MAKREFLGFETIFEEARSLTIRLSSRCLRITNSGGKTVVTVTAIEKSRSGVVINVAWSRNQPERVEEPRSVGRWRAAAAIARL